MIIDRGEEAVEAFDHQLRPWHVGHKPVYVRVAPDIVTGRRFRVDPTHQDVHG